MAYVDFVHGDILEGGYDLTVFPCSAKGTVGRTTEVKLARYGFPRPYPLRHGDISEPMPCGELTDLTKSIVFAASVFNDHSSYEVIKSIGQQLGLLSQKAEYRNIEAPLLGTGAGGLPALMASKALQDGFLETADKDARLTVFLFRTESLKKIHDYLANPLAVQEVALNVPPAVKESLREFGKDNAGRKTGFVIMSFDKSPAHQKIFRVIKSKCASLGIQALRADEKQYADDLLDNILTYVYGCDFGIGVFERIRSNVYNANVSFEAGYMMGIGKPILLLKDDSMDALQTDLTGKLYKSFDYQRPAATLPTELESWLLDKKII